MEGKASEILEDLGKQYLDHLINNYDNKKITTEKSLNENENRNIIKSYNKKKVFIENNPCIEEGEEYYPELIPSFTILYASETGTAEGFGNTLYKEVNERLHLKAKIFNVSEINSVQIFNENSLIVIIASTWGEGEGGPSDDCVDFNKMLKRKKFWEEFTNEKNLNLAIFGLGNTNYTFYNAQGKLFQKILVEEHNLNSICGLYLGDSKYDIEGDFKEWTDNIFFKSLYSFYFFSSYFLLKHN